MRCGSLRDGDGGEADGNDDQTSDRRPVVSEVPRRRVVGSVEQHRCDKERQRELGQDGERGRAGNKREDRAAQRQEHGIRRADATRQGSQHDGGEDQADENFEFPHDARCGDSSRKGSTRRVHRLGKNQ